MNNHSTVQRNRQIRDALKTKSTKQVAADYGLSYQRVLEIKHLYSDPYYLRLEPAPLEKEN